MFCQTQNKFRQATLVKNAELKARIAKLEDKQLQNEIVKNLLSVSRKT